RDLPLQERLHAAQEGSRPRRRRRAHGGREAQGREPERLRQGRRLRGSPAHGGAERGREKIAVASLRARARARLFSSTSTSMSMSAGNAILLDQMLYRAQREVEVVTTPEAFFDLVWEFE